MSAPAGSGETAVFVPDAKPVRRFVAAIALVALALGALWWSGAFAPRLIATCRERTGIGTDADTVRLELANAGPLPVRILGLDGPDETRSRVRIDQRVVPGEGVQLAGGGKAALEVGLDPHLEPDGPSIARNRPRRGSGRRPEGMRWWCGPSPAGSSRCGSARSCPSARSARPWSNPGPDGPSW